MIALAGIASGVVLAGLLLRWDSWREPDEPLLKKKEKSNP